MAVGSTIQASDFVDLAERLTAVLGQGSGQTGYGQRVISYENYRTLNFNNQIDNAEWDQLRQEVNAAYGHITGNNAITGTIQAGRIIGWNATGNSVTRSGESFTITGSVNSTQGVSDIATAITYIEDNSNVVDSGELTIGNAYSFISSTRNNNSWGGAGQDQQISATLQVYFGGGYTTTNSSGGQTSASGADHRRHFFNTGGEIRLNMSLSGFTAKDADWSNMLSNAGTIIFGKNGTTATGTGETYAIGNYQLNTGFQTIFKKYGSSTKYAENYVQISARRDFTGSTIDFRFDFYDVDSGDRTGIGPAVDERVLQLGGDMQVGLALARSTGFITIPAPTGGVSDQL